MLDDVHMFVSILLKNTGSSFMGYFKGKSALMRFDKHANVKYKFGMFWIEGYGVSAGGLNEAIYKNKKSMMITGDKLSIKSMMPSLGGREVI